VQRVISIVHADYSSAPSRSRTRSTNTIPKQLTGAGKTLPPTKRQKTEPTPKEVSVVIDDLELPDIEVHVPTAPKPTHDEVDELIAIRRKEAQRQKKAQKRKKITIDEEDGYLETDVHQRPPFSIRKPDGELWDFGDPWPMDEDAKKRVAEIMEMPNDREKEKAKKIETSRQTGLPLNHNQLWVYTSYIFPSSSLTKNTNRRD
jgi:hypothetical protein